MTMTMATVCRKYTFVIALVFLVTARGPWACRDVGSAALLSAGLLPCQNPPPVLLSCTVLRDGNHCRISSALGTTARCAPPEARGGGWGVGGMGGRGLGSFDTCTAHGALTVLQ